MNKDQKKYQDGEFYIIDKDFANGGRVKLLKHGNYFCTVEDPDNGVIWETMLNRLTPIVEAEVS